MDKIREESLSEQSNSKQPKVNNLKLNKRAKITLTVLAVIVVFLLPLVIGINSNKSDKSDTLDKNSNIDINIKSDSDTSDRNIDININENGTYVCSRVEDGIYATLVEKGYSPAGACGILGNISVENPDFEPDLYANNGKTYGLFQWTNTGDRQNRLKRWCNNRSLSYNQVEGQLAFALYELNGGDSIAKRVNDYLITTEDSRSAATGFAVGFERCIGPTGNKEADGVYTGRIYPEFYGATYQALNRRMDRAEEYYKKYSSRKVNSQLAYNLKMIPKVGIVAEKEDLIFEIVPVIEITIKRNPWPYRMIGIAIGYLFGCVLGAPIITGNAQKRGLFSREKMPSIRYVIKYFGFKESAIAIIIDVVKFYLALLIASLIARGALKGELVLWTGLGVVLGNDFPFWRSFRGGMGIIVSTLLICTYMPIWGLFACLIGLIIAVGTKSFPFGAIFVSIAAVPYAFICKDIKGGIIILVVMIIVLAKHVKFIQRFVDKELLRDHYSRLARNKEQV